MLACFHFLSVPKGLGLYTILHTSLTINGLIRETSCSKVKNIQASSHLWHSSVEMTPGHSPGGHCAVAPVLKFLYWTGWTGIMRELTPWWSPSKVYHTLLFQMWSWDQQRGVIWEFVEQAESQTPPIHLLNQNLRFNKIPGDTYAYYILRSTADRKTRTCPATLSSLLITAPKFHNNQEPRKLQVERSGSTIKANQGRCLLHSP